MGYAEICRFKELSKLKKIKKGNQENTVTIINTATLVKIDYSLLVTENITVVKIL